ncbi:MAG: glucose-1-phosphate adenylyltransferase [Candidatus Sumerlaeaceae bacterium]
MLKANGDASNVVAIVLGGGRGTRLYPLTRYRSKPAVPLAGKYRLVDVPISNCIHSGIRQIYVLTQFNSASLNRHVAQTYTFDQFSGGFVEILAAEQTPEAEEWFQGTADAVRRTLMHIGQPQSTHILILAGDALYRQDYSQVLSEHIRDQADITLCCKLVDSEQAGAFGIVGIDEERRVASFHEKPKGEALAPLMVDPDMLRQAGVHGDPLARPYLASMGIYLFRKEVLLEMLSEGDDHDFGRQLIPRAIQSKRVFANLFDGYWEDIGTISAFFQANLDLLAEKPHFDFYESGCPIYTHCRLLPSSQVFNSTVEGALIAEGCIINDAELRNAIVGIRSMIGSGAKLENVVMMGADYYDCESPTSSHLPPLGVGRNVHVRNAIIDKNARIGDGARILNEAGADDVDSDYYSIKDGVVVIPKNAIVPAGAVI